MRHWLFIRLLRRNAIKAGMNRAHGYKRCDLKCGCRATLFPGNAPASVRIDLCDKHARRVFAG